MNFDKRISPVIAAIIIVAVILSANIMLESFSIIVEAEMDIILNAF
jgi:flagellin-like protein